LFRPSPFSWYREQDRRDVAMIYRKISKQVSATFISSFVYQPISLNLREMNVDEYNSRGIRKEKRGKDKERWKGNRALFLFF